jgi:cytochrome P450
MNQDGATTAAGDSERSDYDIFDDGFIADPYPTYAELRGRCPVAHSTEWGGSWMPTRYDDISAVAHDSEHFTSVEVGVTRTHLPDRRPGSAPPITSDPPEHTPRRRLLLPAFSPRAVARYEESTRALCRRLLDGFVADGRADGAADYAQQIPPRVIADLLGIDASRADEFVEWTRGSIELAVRDPEAALFYGRKLKEFFTEEIERRQDEPGEDLISHLLAERAAGADLPDRDLIGMLNLVLVAGIDTTWSSIGSALWHLARHPDDRRRLASDPSVWPTAIEELLRAYSPVTMARLVREEVTVGDRTLHPGERVLLAFPSANRDESVFERADEVVLDRAENRHLAFGAGIHRCAGSNLARLEMTVALQEWMAAIPEFELADPAAVTWAGGQVRGPRALPLRW